ncbi:MAG: hypothetical protein KC431_00025, partial [Myxococcales bacterium]|nr:hypothetical protein [Myxococcales bacterium]
MFVERPDSVARRIAETLGAGFDARGKWIICGSVGAGKSTELTRLARLLADDFVVIGVDLWQAAGRIDEISPAEILFCIGAAAVWTARERFAHDVEAARVENLRLAFEGLLQEQRKVDVSEVIESVALLSADLLAPGTGGIAKKGLDVARQALTAGRRLSGRARVGGLTRPVKEGDPALDALTWAVDEILDDLRQVREPLILVDGLDKLTQIDSIRELFATSKVLASPRAPLIYTGPVTLMVAAEWSAAGNHFARERLSNLAVEAPVSRSRKVGAETIAAGRRSMRDVVERRCKTAGIELSAAFSEDSLELFIGKSGGLLRQMLKILRGASKQAGLEGCGRVELDLAVA